MFRIAPSLMCANLLELGEEVRELERAQVESFHIDIMDGHFVPNLGLSFDLARQVRDITNVPLDLHLMVSNPEDYISMVQSTDASYVSFHIEAARHPMRLARAFKAVGVKVGLAINPSTSHSGLEYIVSEFDYVLVMTVEPGFAGQTFIGSMYSKVKSIREILDPVRPDAFIQVDGNLDASTSSRCIMLGASILVGGSSSVFRRRNGLFADCLEFRKQVEEQLQALQAIPHSDIETIRSAK